MHPQWEIAAGSDAIRSQNQGACELDLKKNAAVRIWNLFNPPGIFFQFVGPSI